VIIGGNIQVLFGLAKFCLNILAYLLIQVSCLPLSYGWQVRLLAGIRSSSGRLR
jgi:hypothetical protein